MTTIRRSTASRLSRLSDVNLTSPQEGDLLQYDSATNKWINVAPIWEEFEGTVTNGTTGTLDTIDVNNFSIVKYIVSIDDTTNNKTTILEMMVRNINGSISDTVYGKLSGGIDYAINAINDSGNLKLQLQNNESVDLTIT